jgi:hypothetical protein
MGESTLMRLSGDARMALPIDRAYSPTSLIKAMPAALKSLRAAANQCSLRSEKLNAELEGKYRNYITTMNKKHEEKRNNINKEGEYHHRRHDEVGRRQGSSTDEGGHR